MDPTRLQVLLDRHVDGLLSAEEKAELELLLLSSPQAREAFWCHANWNVLLREFGEQAWGRSLAAPAPKHFAAPNESPLPARKSRRWRWLAGAFGAAAAVTVTVLLSLRSLPISVPAAPNSPPAALPEDATSDGVAVLTQAVDARWSDEGLLPIQPGTILSAGTLRLQTGLAQIEFFSGGTVILEGPAEFTLVSPKEALLARGRIRVNVPVQARGFRVRSARADVLDLGTEFGMRTASGGPTEVHVFDGEVQIYEPNASPNAKPRMALSSGQGVRLDAAGLSVETPASPAEYPSAAEIRRRADAASLSRQAIWRQRTEALRADPRVLRYFDFQPQHPWTRTLSNRAGLTGAAGDAAVVGCQWTDGRWPGKDALDFRRIGDRVCINLPGEFNALTLMVSIRLDNLETRYGGLLMSDDYPAGGVHWQVAKEGTVTLGIQNPNLKDGVNYMTPVILGPELLGKWIHLAVVVDPERGQVSHYLNGRRVVSKPMIHNHPIHIDSAQLGNWGHSDEWRSAPIRNITGRMDEFLVFNVPLDDAEILALTPQN